MDVCVVLFYFFFSSRRRHTRSLCDWSSDVCSSDLGISEQAGCQRVGGPVRAVNNDPPAGQRLRRTADGGEQMRQGLVCIGGGTPGPPRNPPRDPRAAPCLGPRGQPCPPPPPHPPPPPPA